MTKKELIDALKDVPDDVAVEILCGSDSDGEDIVKDLTSICYNISFNTVELA